VVVVIVVGFSFILPFIPKVYVDTYKSDREPRPSAIANKETVRCLYANLGVWVLVAKCRKNDLRARAMVKENNRVAV